MKKLKSLLGTVAFLAIAFTVLPLQAQTPVKTYFNENYRNGSDSRYPGLNPQVWDLSACTNVTAEDGPLYFVQMEDGSLWGGWLYDPNGDILEGGVPTPLNGDYNLISKPITLEADAANVVEVDFTYATSYLGHTFSIRVRETGDTKWEDVVSVNPYTSTSPLIAVLPSKWSGKTIEMAIVFNVQLQTGYPYYFLMEGIRFLAYENKPVIATQNVTPPFAHGNNMDLILKISNPAPVSVSSVSYVYSIDEGEEKTLPFSINPSMDMTEMVRVTAQISMEGLSYDKHTLKIREDNVNGLAYEGQTLEMNFTYVDASTLTSTYVPVFESFTSSTCDPCATVNAALNPTQNALRDAGVLNVVKYQMNWPGNGDPYYIAANQTRMQFYDGLFGWDGSWSVPTPIYNGLENVMDWPGFSWSDIADLLQERATEDHQKKALMDIRITHASLDASKKMTIKLEVTPKVTTQAKVIVVIAEGTTTGNRGTNGEKEFHHVALRLPANGEVREFEAGKTETFEYTARMQTTHMEEADDLEILCFIQHESGYIFQSSSVVEGGVVANEVEVLGDIRIYPNPAAENVTVGNLSDADVEMFDITGRRVYKNEGVNGNLQMTLTSFAEGSYVIRVTQNGKTAHRKLVIVR